MDVYGVDVGQRRLAVACPATGHLSEIVLPKVARGHREDVPAALQQLAAWFTATVPPGAVIWVESAIAGGSGNVATAIRMAESCGAVFAAHPGRGFKVNLTTWKAKVVGHGHADKPAVKQWLSDHRPALTAACGESQDLVDACCIGLYGELVQAGELPGPTDPGVLRRRRRRTTHQTDDTGADRVSPAGMPDVQCAFDLPDVRLGRRREVGDLGRVQPART